MQRDLILPRTNPATPQLPNVLIGAALAVAALVLLPLAYLVLRAAQAKPEVLREVLLRQTNLWLLLNTLALGFGVLLVATALALPLAWLATRSDLRPRWLVLLVGVLPLAIPGYVGAFTLLAASGPGGVLEVLLGIVWPRPSGYWGALGTLALFTYPYLFLNFWTALRTQDGSLEDAGRSLGQSRWQVFWRVTVPMLRPAWLAGALLVWLHVLGDFGVVSLMRFPTFSAAIYLQYSTALDRVYAAWLSLTLLAITSSVLLLEARLSRRVRVARVGVGASKASAPAPLGAWRWVAHGFVALLAGAALLVPLGTIFYWLLHGQDRFVSPWQNLLPAFWNSSLAAAPTAVLAVVLALPLAYLAARFPTPLTRALERVAYLGYATPGLALALAFVFFSLAALPGLYQSVPLMVLALGTHFLAEAMGPLRSALLLAPRKLEEAARGLGLGAWMTFVRVTLPLIRRGMASSAALVFLSAVKELPISFLLSPPGFDTLAKNVYAYTSEALFAEAAPHAFAVVLLSALFVGSILKER